MGPEILQTGLELFGGGKKTPSEGPGLFGKIMDFVGLGGNKNPEIAKQAVDAKEAAETERGGIFSEIGRSLLMRQFPRAAVVFDLAKTGQNIKEKGWAEGLKDAFTSFSSISAILVLVPNRWKHHLTDLFANSTIFQKMVEYWPGMDGVDLPIVGKTGFMSKDLPILGKGGSLRDRILNEKDPDAVVEAIRIMHQDIFVTGKVTFDWVKDKLGVGGGIAALAGGAGALALGAHALGDGGSSSPGGSPADKIKGALGLGAAPSAKPGPKILDLAKAHPEKEKTTMQKNLLSLLRAMRVEDSAELVPMSNGILRGSNWEGNNGKITVSYIFDNAKYFMIFYNGYTSTDITVNPSDGGAPIYNETDTLTFNPEEDAKEIIDAMRKHPSPALPPAQPTKPAEPAKPGQQPPAQPKK